MVPRKDPPEEEKPVPAKRLCTHKGRFGMPCPLEAEEDSLVCRVHGDQKVTVQSLRRDAIKLGPLFLERMEEVATTGNNIEVGQHFKLWMDFIRIQDMPATETGLDEEELDAARRTLSAKLDSVLTNIAKRKTA